MAKLKKDCTPEEWAARLKRQREYMVKYSADPEKKALMNAASRRRNAVVAADPELRKARNEAKKKYKSHPQRRIQDRLRNKHPTRRLASRVRRYGLKPDDYHALLEIQGNACGVCRRSFDEVTPHIDHCHQSGKVRGVLCAGCNSIEGKIGFLGLTPEEFIQRLRAYLDNHPSDEKFW